MSDFTRKHGEILNGRQFSDLMDAYAESNRKSVWLGFWAGVLVGIGAMLVALPFIIAWVETGTWHAIR